MPASSSGVKRLADARSRTTSGGRRSPGRRGRGPSRRPPTSRFAASTTCWSSEPGSRIAVIWAAISRSEPSASARRASSIDDRSSSSISRAFWIAIAAWSAMPWRRSAWLSSYWSGRRLLTEIAPSDPDSPRSGAHRTDRKPVALTSVSDRATCSNAAVGEVVAGPEGLAGRDGPPGDPLADLGTRRRSPRPGSGWRPRPRRTPSGGSRRRRRACRSGRTSSRGAGGPRRRSAGGSPPCCAAPRCSAAISRTARSASPGARSRPSSGRARRSGGRSGSRRRPGPRTPTSAPRPRRRRRRAGSSRPSARRAAWIPSINGVARTDLSPARRTKRVGVLEVVDPRIGEVVAGDHRRPRLDGGGVDPDLGGGALRRPGRSPPNLPSPDAVVQRIRPVAGSTMSSWERSPERSRRAASVTCWRSSVGSRIAVIRVAISRSSCSARARRGSRRRSARGPRSGASCGSRSPPGGRAPRRARPDPGRTPRPRRSPTWRTPRSVSSTRSGVITSDRTPSSATARSRPGIVAERLVVEVVVDDDRPALGDRLAGGAVAVRLAVLVDRRAADVRPGAQERVADATGARARSGRSAPARRGAAGRPRRRRPGGGRTGRGSR